MNPKKPKMNPKFFPVNKPSVFYSSSPFDKTPVEFPELQALDFKVSKFLSPLSLILPEGKASTPSDFQLTEIVEFQAFPYTFPN